MMPECKKCPIIKECNAHAVHVNRPVKWEKGKAVKYIKERLCPLVMALARLQPPQPQVKVVSKVAA